MTKLLLLILILGLLYIIYWYKDKILNDGDEDDIGKISLQERNSQFGTEEKGEGVNSMKGINELKETKGAKGGKGTKEMRERRGMRDTKGTKGLKEIKETKFGRSKGSHYNEPKKGRSKGKSILDKYDPIDIETSTEDMNSANSNTENSNVTGNSQRSCDSLGTHQTGGALDDYDFGSGDTNESNNSRQSSDIFGTENNATDQLRLN